ncbi:50S ribosomal protein L24 [Nigerium massiliense]|uniref:50S ribosomal protein L24 n=1 Tax=Nigerium massiliense TaxID=1522317 RepID=UPI000590F02F|nr:50S ribosomal protein L24 [Nigerium massiliense]
MAHSLHVKKGDRVKVIAGDDKGKIGEIISVDPRAQKVVVEGVNLVKKHRAANPQAGQSAGSIVTTEAPIHVSNVQLVVGSGADAELTRVGYERREVTKRRADGSEYSGERSYRIARKTGKEI